MRARSWMAALALIAGTSIAVGRAMSAASPTEEPGQAPSQEQAQQAERPKGGSQPSKPRPAEEPIKAVLLNLEIAGLGHDGCDVEVAPGNPSCKFRVVNMTRDGGKLVRGKDGAQHVSSIGQAILELQNVELRGADRTCTVKITVRESGRPPKTVYRGFRLPARTEVGPTVNASQQAPTFTCYLSSPSKVANVEQPSTRK
jgi:hypothetical protein